MINIVIFGSHNNISDSPGRAAQLTLLELGVFSRWSGHHHPDLKILPHFPMPQAGESPSGWPGPDLGFGLGIRTETTFSVKFDRTGEKCRRYRLITHKMNDLWRIYIIYTILHFLSYYSTSLHILACSEDSSENEFGGFLREFFRRIPPSRLDRNAWAPAGGPPSLARFVDH